MGDVARLFAVTVDCPEPLALARFYQAFAGGEVTSVGDDFAVLSGGAVRIDFQRVGNPASRWPDGGAPRKVHLDFRVEEMARLEARVLFHELPPGGRLELARQDGQDGEHREVLLAAGFVEISTIDRTVRATKPRAPEGVVIRPMRDSDADDVLAIFQAGIDGGQASFETAAPAWEEFDRAKLPLHRYVAVDAETAEILGWVAAVATSSRCAYAGVVEHSVYVAPGRSGRGIGAALLDALIGSTEAAGIWTVQSGVFPENTPSLRLHERAGFRVVGTRERVGRHHGRWRDVLLIERRSTLTGTD